MSLRTQKGNGTPKAKPAAKQQQQLNRGIAPLMLQALAVTASDEKEWDQVGSIKSTESIILSGLC